MTEEMRKFMRENLQDDFVKQLTPFIEKAEEIKFLGGEPFITPIYFQIWDLIAEVNPTVKIVITTNATILTKKVKWLFEKHRFFFKEIQED